MPEQFWIGLFIGFFGAMHIFIYTALLLPKQTCRFLWPKDQMDFGHGTIYRKGKAPERV